MRFIFTLLALSIAFVSQAQVQPPINAAMVGHKAYPCLSSLWGYTAPNGTEYAIVGSCDGTSIVSLADLNTMTEVAFIPGTQSIWREVKTWRNYAYVTTEANDGLLIIDLTNLPTSVRHVWRRPHITINGQPDSISRIHSLTIDDSGYLFLNGTNPRNFGTYMFDLNSDPENPPLVTGVNNRYCHDVYSRGNYLYTSDIYEGYCSVFDISNRNNPQFVTDWLTPNQFNHNAWLSDNGQYIFTTDERANSFVACYDISDLNNVREVSRWQNPYTTGRGVVPHNVRVKDDFVVTAHYTDGVTIIDAHRPENPVMVAWFDTYPGADGGFEGVWEAYPYFPSGLTIASDRSEGLFVIDFNHARASYLEGTVTSQQTGQAIFDAKVKITATTEPQSSTDVSGNYRTGYHQGGTYTIEYYKPNYRRVLRSANLAPGNVTTINVALEAAGNVSQQILVVDSITRFSIPNASILVNGNTYITNASGIATIPSIQESYYSAEISKAGYFNKTYPTLYLGGSLLTLEILSPTSGVDQFAEEMQLATIFDEQYFISESSLSLLLQEGFDKVVLIGMDGRIIQTADLSSSLNFGEIPSGMYMLQFKGSGKEHSIKVLRG